MPDELRRVMFTKGSLFRRGYDELQVDEALEKLAATMASQPYPAVLAGQLGEMTFARARPGARGYSMDQVDGIIGQVLGELSRGDDPPDLGPTRPGRHLTTERSAADSAKRAERDASRRGRAAILGGADPVPADLSPTITWARRLTASGYGQPLAFVLFAVIPTVIAATGALLTAASGQFFLGWWEACVALGAWLWATIRAVKIRFIVRRWLGTQLDGHIDTGIDGLFGTEPPGDTQSHHS